MLLVRVFVNFISPFFYPLNPSKTPQKALQNTPKQPRKNLKKIPPNTCQNTPQTPPKQVLKYNMYLF